MRGFISIYFNSASSVKPTTIIEDISKIKNVKFPHLVTGDVDAMAFLDAPDADTFRDGLLAINAVNGVDHTRTNAAF